MTNTDSNLAIHLTDRALTPLLSTSRASETEDPSSVSQSQVQASALSTLTTTALTAYDSSSRLGLGIPQRIMVETHSGPMILHSFLNGRSHHSSANNLESGADGERDPSQTSEQLRPLSGSTEDSYLADEGGWRNISEGPTNGVPDSGYDRNHECNDSAMQESERKSRHVPLLVATVVAGKAEELRDAKRAATRLEETGREFQREWARDLADERRGEGNDG